MKTKSLAMAAMAAVLCAPSATAESADDAPRFSEPAKTTADTCQAVHPLRAKKESKGEKLLRRLTLGGYGEAVVSRNFYSDSYLRYSGNNISAHKDDTHGRFDLPHVVIFLGYDFGKGWSMGSEIEFEHGGTESAVEIETHEAGEYESEIERGGEVALEQFWIQKSFMPELNLRLGHMVVPVGGTNMYHLPTEFFGVYRPEGDNTIMPCTWHETGVSLWGQLFPWLRYEVMFMPGLDSERFGSQNWIKYGSASPYEFKIGNSYAGAYRVDFTPVKDLRLSVSGYVGNSFKNTLYPTSSSTYDGVKGRVAIESFDFSYTGHNWIVRGSATYGHLTDAAAITRYNLNMPKVSPSKKMPVAESAYSIGAEVGYDFFSLSRKLREKQQKLYLFGRYDAYDSMHSMESGVPYEWCGRQRVAVGLNYFPIKDIVVKGEYSIGLLKSPYYNEPSVSLGVAYSGFFL